MWKQVVALMCLASAIKCQDITFEQQATLKVSDIDSRRAKVVSIYTGQQTILQNTQLGINSVVANLPNSIITDRQSEAFSMLEVLAALTLNTNEQVCLQDLATTKAYILAGARNSIYLKLQSLSLGITSTSAQIYAGIAKVNNAAVTARTKAITCGTNPTFKVSETVFKYCLETAEASFKTQESSSTDEQTAITTKTNGFVTDIVKYETETIQTADKALSDYVDRVKSCIKNAANVDVLNSLLPTITAIADNVYSDQVNNVPETDSDLGSAKTDAQQSLSEAATKVNDASTAKSVTLTSATTYLTTNFSASKTGFDNAINQFASNRAAYTCVNNIRSTITNNIYRGATQYVTCVAAISSSTLATNLYQVQQSISQSQSSEGGVTLQCVTKVENLFIDSGIMTCRKEAQTDITIEYKIAKFKALTLKEEAAAVESKAGRCRDIAVNLSARQISKDKLAFENCIYKATKTKYTIQTQ